MSEAHTDLNGRVVFVSGGGRGLGASICQVLGAAGARIAIADIRIQSAREVAQTLHANHVQAWPIELDVTRPREVERALSALAAEAGAIDAVVNNAGIDVTAAIDALSVEEWDRVLSTNLSAAFYLCRSALPHLRRSSAPHVVNIVSTAARRAWPNAAAYHASKWGLLGLSHALHAELRPAGIKVTAIVAGGMRTPFLLDRFPDIPLENLQEPVNVAHAVRFALTQPAGSVIPELMVLPMRETSWP